MLKYGLTELYSNIFVFPRPVMAGIAQEHTRRLIATDIVGMLLMQ